VNTLAYYDTVTITAVKIFVQAPGVDFVNILGAFAAAK
jgi:hypothetical protein